MVKFINDYASYLYLVVEIIAAVTGLILYKRYRHTAAKYFIYFLIYVVVFGVIGRYTFWVRDGIFSFLQGTLLEKNYWWYTICWSLGAIVFFVWYYLKILTNQRAKSTLKIALTLFLIASLCIIILTLPDFFKTSIPSISVLGAIIIMLCVFYYFFEMLQSDKILKFYKSLNFYISCTILVFWLVKTPLAFFEPYFRVADMDYVNLRGYINLFAISLMYLTFTVGLIVSNPDYD